MGEARTADLLVGLSRMADLGFGLEVGSAVSSCLAATRLARSLSLPEDDVRVAFYTALLHHVGCVGYAHETTRLFGDDLAANAAVGRTDTASATDLVTTFLPALLQGQGVVRRAGTVLALATRGRAWGDGYVTAACELGRDTARRLGLPEAVQASLMHVYDLWSGPGPVGAVHGEDIPVGARVARAAAVATLFASLGGAHLAVAQVRRRAGGMLDPGIVDHLGRRGDEILGGPSGGRDGTDARAAVLAAEPAPHATADVTEVATVFGDLADLKAPCFTGHSRAVADLAAGAAQRLGMPAEQRSALHVAGLLHDLGRVGVPTLVWEKDGPLTPDEWEQARLHPYLSERILVASAELTPLVPLVGHHHERLDGSGYHRGCTAHDLSRSGRVLAAADAYRTSTEPRPHRAAARPDQAARRVTALADRGLLDGEAVRAVLSAAGHPGRSTDPPSQGLSGREVDVLRLVAQGSSNRDIAARLVISRRTAEHHVQHIYAKIGVSSRAAATLYAVEHGLLGDPGPNG